MFEMPDKKPFKLTYRTDKLARLYGKCKGDLGSYALRMPSVAVETGHYVNKPVGFGQEWLLSKVLTSFRDSSQGRSFQEYTNTWHSETTFPEMLSRLGFELEDPAISYDLGTRDLIYFTGAVSHNPKRLIIDGLELSQHPKEIQELVMFLLEICWRRHLSKPLYSTMTVKVLNNTNNTYFTDELLRPLVRLLPDVELIFGDLEMSAQKITDVEHVDYNGKPRTLFKLWRLVDNAWVFQGRYGVKGHFVRHSTLIKKRQEMLQEKS